MENLEFRTGVLRPIEIYKEAWEIMKGEFWMIFGVTLLGMLIGGILPLILTGPMMCGIYMCLLDKIDGRPVAFDKLFKGFDYFVAGLIVTLFVMIPTLIFIFAIYIPMIGVAIAGPQMDQTALLAFLVATIVVELIIAIVMIFIHSLIIFAFPLIVDRKQSGIQAVKTSAKAVWGNLAGIAGLFGVGFVVCFIGFLLFCVGIYLAMPIVMMSTAVAYRKVFPVQVTGQFDQPATTFGQM
jgi:uncharacterized membrane protein